MDDVEVTTDGGDGGSDDGDDDGGEFGSVRARVLHLPRLCCLGITHVCCIGIALGKA